MTCAALLPGCTGVGKPKLDARDSMPPPVLGAPPPPAAAEAGVLPGTMGECGALATLAMFSVRCCMDMLWRALPPPPDMRMDSVRVLRPGCGCVEVEWLNTSPASSCTVVPRDMDMRLAMRRRCGSVSRLWWCALMSLGPL